MTTINVQNEVEQAVDMHWDDFARTHPHLSAAMDRQLLARQVMASLQEDPAYQAAMEKAAAVGMAAESIGGVIKRFVGDFFAGL